jgi:hypothetical protein
VSSWKGVEGNPYNRDFKQISTKEYLQNLTAKLSSLYGYVTTMQDDLDSSFQKLKKQNEKHLKILLRKLDCHFYIMIILNYFLFYNSNFKDICFLFLSLLTQILEQNIFSFFKLFT